MHRLRLPFSLVLALGCASATAPGTLAPRPARPDVDALLDSLPLERRVAQLVMPWIGGEYAADDDPDLARARSWVDSLGVGGVIISIGPPTEVAAKLNLLQRAATLPLLVASDLEGGTAFRLRGGTAFPTNMGVGATGDPAVAYAMGRVTAAEARAVGIHLTFSPVADVNNNPDNPIINTRSFGEDPTAVADMVAAAIRGAEEHGLLTTAKHFPGHGDTGTDSHITLPVITADWARLDSVELVPFRAAVAAGVTAVMSAHVAMPGVTGGPEVAATVSPAVLTGLLRDTLGFEGLAVTDALDMGALVERHGGGEAAVLALEAGADLLLQPTDPVEAVRAVTAAVRSGRVSEARLDRSVRRILELKGRLGLMTRRTVDLDAVPSAVGTADHLAVAADAAARSLVLVRDTAGTVTALRRGPGPVTLITYSDGTATGAGRRVASELRRLGYDVASATLTTGDPVALDSVRALLDADRPVVIVASVRVSAWRGTLGLPPWMADLVSEATARRPTVLVSLGSPYLLRQAPGVPALLLAWAPGPLTEAAVARALAGQTPITGRLPISLPGGPYPVGWGLQVPAP